MFEANKGQAAPLKGQGLSIGIVQARFNEGVTNALAAACIAELQLHGVEAAHIQHVKVPGALEVPLAMLLDYLSRRRWDSDHRRHVRACLAQFRPRQVSPQGDPKQSPFERMSRGLASLHLMTDFSSNHFQKIRAIPTMIKNDRSNRCAAKETACFL